MKKHSWKILLVLALVGTSVSWYLVHYAIFRDSRHIFLYLIGDIAFLPVQVLFVTLIVDRLLNRREKMAMLKKMNMVIGVFFTEIGRSLLETFKGFDSKAAELGKGLLIEATWTKREYSEATARCRAHESGILLRTGDLEKLRNFYLGKRDFLVSLMENPNLLEHQSFTDLLWAVFHLLEELAVREDVGHLPEADMRHIVGDINRVYALLLVEWLAYLAHLKADYPYLFSLALRMNPFDPDALPEIR
ncbi:MAG: hypothetical protein M0Z38_01900 [Deltaproteobacteria bacterium]|nr:hypothetical protein [Deltaproteobacteria bacterium]